MCNDHGKATCLPRGRIFCGQLGAHYRGTVDGGCVASFCSSPDSPMASSLSALVPEYGRLGSCHAKVSLALLRAALSPLGELMREGHALSPSGAPADSQGCRSVGPLCARTGKSCLDHLLLFSVSVPHVFLSSPPHFKVSPSLRAFHPLSSPPLPQRGLGSASGYKQSLPPQTPPSAPCFLSPASPSCSHPALLARAPCQDL